MALSALRTCRLSLNLTRVGPPTLCPSYRKISYKQKSVYKRDEVEKIRFYFLKRFLQYIKNYDKVLEKSFPATMQTYRVFMDGIKTFTKDSITYFKIVRMLYTTEGSYKKLLRRELELYHQMPKDMMKVGPTLFVASLPFAFYVILPLIYALPKQLLTSHFWTIEQKSKYGVEFLHDRLTHNKPVFRHLQSQLPFIKRSLHNEELFKKWAGVLGSLGSGTQPKVEDILDCKELFMDEPYHLYYLSRNHVYHLLKVHDIHRGWFRRVRLMDRALILIEMDKAILREGGVHNMTLDVLRHSCYIRGLNPTNVSEKHMVDWLTRWIKISSEMEMESLSLLLHCPILLGYNEPSNWRLIYRVKNV